MSPNHQETLAFGSYFDSRESPWDSLLISDFHQIMAASIPRMYSKRSSLMPTGRVWKSPCTDEFEPHQPEVRGVPVT